VRDGRSSVDQRSLIATKAAACFKSLMKTPVGRTTPRRDVQGRKCVKEKSRTNAARLKRARAVPGDNRGRTRKNETRHYAAS
jgi:hypothetical protein